MNSEMQKLSVVQVQENRLALKITVGLSVISQTPTENIGLILKEGMTGVELLSAKIFFNKNEDMPVFLQKLQSLINKESETKNTK